MVTSRKNMVFQWDFFGLLRWCWWNSFPEAHHWGIDSGNMSIVGEPRKLTLSSSRIPEAQRVDLNVLFSRHFVQELTAARTANSWPFLGEVPVRFLSMCARWLHTSRKNHHCENHRSTRTGPTSHSSPVFGSIYMFDHGRTHLTPPHTWFMWLPWRDFIYWMIVGIYPVYRSSIMCDIYTYKYL